MGSSAEGSSSAADVAVRQYVDHLAIERGLARNSLLSYRRDLGRYLDFLTEVGVSDVDQISEGHVLAFLGRLREGDAEHQPLAASWVA